MYNVAKCRSQHFSTAEKRIPWQQGFLRGKNIVNELTRYCQMVGRVIRTRLLTKKTGESMAKKMNIKKLKMLFKNTSPSCYHIRVFFPYSVTLSPISLICRPSHCPSLHTACSSPTLTLLVNSLPHSTGCGRGGLHCPQDQLRWVAFLTTEGVLCFRCRHLGWAFGASQRVLRRFLV